VSTLFVPLSPVSLSLCHLVNVSTIHMSTCPLVPLTTYQMPTCPLPFSHVPPSTFSHVHRTVHLSSVNTSTTPQGHMVTQSHVLVLPDKDDKKSYWLPKNTCFHLTSICCVYREKIKKYYEISTLLQQIEF